MVNSVAKCSSKDDTRMRSGVAQLTPQAHLAKGVAESEEALICG